MKISCFEKTNGTTNTPLQLFHLDPGLVCSKIYRSVAYNSVKGFNSFVQSTFNVVCQVDESANSKVVAETKNLLAISSFVYQFMGRNRHSIPNFTNDEKTHAAINNKMFKRFGHINDQNDEEDLAKSENEHKEPILVGCFILQHAKLRMLGSITTFSQNCVILTSTRRSKYIPIHCK